MSIVKIDSHKIKVDRLLSEIEQDKDVFILYSIESGSRAWGFPSKNSDYDIRGVYTHHRDWYLSIDIENKRDTITVLDGDLDVHLWDLRKALYLIGKSNPAIFEWFRSPIRYRETPYSELIRAERLDFYSPKRLAYHYWHMAKSNFDRYLQGDIVKAKKYLYVLRPILTLINIEEHEVIPPIEIDYLLSDAINAVDQDILKRIYNLVQEKRSGKEMGEIEQDWDLYNFMEQQLDRLETLPEDLPDSDADREKLNKVFRKIVLDIL